MRTLPTAWRVASDPDGATQFAAHQKEIGAPLEFFAACGNASP
jgi:hypothetical protein